MTLSSSGKILTDLSDKDKEAAINNNKPIFTNYFDLNFVSKLVDKVILPVDQAYFRSRYIGFEHIEQRDKEEAPTIFYSNHSGMAFPWDGMLMCSRSFQLNQYNLSKFLRPLIAPVLSSLKILNPFLIKDLWKRVGAIDANYMNFETMMHQKNTHLMVYPEGIKGIGKGFNKRYQVQPFATSFIRLACQYKAAVCPIFTVNAEYINPYTYIYRLTNRVAQKTGLPFLPVGFMLPFLLFFPWLFYYSWPARITYIKGKLFKPWELINKAPGDITEKDIVEIVSIVQKKYQQQLTEQVEHYGKKAIEWKHYFKNLFKRKKLFPLTTPFGWPLLYAEFERRFQLDQTGNFDMEFGWKAFFKYLIKNPFFIWFYIPIIGWLPIALRGFKRTK